MVVEEAFDGGLKVGHRLEDRHTVYMVGGECERSRLMALKPWDDRPHPQRGDKNANTTYAAVGRALTQWEYLEVKLAELFSQLVGGEWPSDGDGPPYHPADRAYGSVLGSAARLTMVEEAAKAHFQWYPNRATEKRLKDLISTECRNFASKRNNIAHGIVDLRFSDPPELKLGHWLVPSFYATKKHPLNGPSAYAYTSAEINYFTYEFDRLWVKTGELISDIARDQHHSP